MATRAGTDLFVPGWLDGWTETSLEEVVNRVGTAGYTQWTYDVQSWTEEVYLDWSGWARVPQLTNMEVGLGSAWRRAWADGLGEYGLTMDDMTAEELLTLNAQIAADEAQVRGYIL